MYRELTNSPAATPKCNLPCVTAAVQFKTLLMKIKDLRDKADNVVIDVVQFQSTAKEYQEPDARMTELACRTNGTYQFINTSKFDRSKPDEWTKAFNGAMERVRYSLAGNWRPAFKIPTMEQAEPVGIGKLAEMKGGMKFENAKFASLAPAYQLSDSWRFAHSGAEDRRLVFRRSACASSADCGGADECGANHCTAAGLCVARPAPDQLACGGDTGGKRCCGGKCATGSCPGACK